MAGAQFRASEDGSSRLPRLWRNTNSESPDLIGNRQSVTFEMFQRDLLSKQNISERQPANRIEAPRSNDPAIGVQFEDIDRPPLIDAIARARLRSEHLEKAMVGELRPLRIAKMLLEQSERSLVCAAPVPQRRSQGPRRSCYRLAHPALQPNQKFDYRCHTRSTSDEARDEYRPGRCGIEAVDAPSGGIVATESNGAVAIPGQLPKHPLGICA